MSAIECLMLLAVIVMIVHTMQLRKDIKELREYRAKVISEYKRMTAGLSKE